MRMIGTGWLDRLGRVCVVAGLALLPLAAGAVESDPWEGVNRVIFRFNDTLDTYALKPVAQGYQAVTPTSSRMACTTCSATSAMSATWPTTCCRRSSTTPVSTPVA